MRKTGDLIIDTILMHFRKHARTSILADKSVDIESCLGAAMFWAKSELKRSKISEKEFQEHVLPKEENIREMCRKIALEMEKRGSLTDIRKTSIEVILEDFEKRTGLDMAYKVRDNHSVGFCVKLQPKQYIKFGVSYSKVLTPGWLDGMEKDLKELIEISSRLGRMTMSAVAK